MTTTEQEIDAVTHSFVYRCKCGAAIGTAWDMPDPEIHEEVIDMIREGYRVEYVENTAPELDDCTCFRPATKPDAAPARFENAFGAAREVILPSKHREQ